LSFVCLLHPQVGDLEASHAAELAQLRAELETARAALEAQLNSELQAHEAFYSTQAAFKPSGGVFM
jgi:hypothetical protein